MATHLPHLPRLPIAVDPLIAEAKRRTRLRRLLLAVLAGVVALAVGLTLGLRPGGQPKPQGSGAGTFAQSVLPKDRLIVLDRSIGPVRLGESRKSLETALGRGIERPRGDRAIAYYFGGRLRVTYGDHGMLRPYVMSIWTSWAGFHTASGLRVGASAEGAKRDPRLTCMRDGTCMNTAAWRQMYVLHHAEPSPLTTVLLEHGVITGFGIQ
jgi:hypothetical protein